MTYIAFCGHVICKKGNQLTTLHSEEGAVFFCLSELSEFLD